MDVAVSRAEPSPDAPEQAPAGSVASRANAIVQSRWFSRAVIATIVVNSVVVALETDRTVATRYGSALAAAHVTIIALFGLELVLRLVAHGRNWRAFFADGWTRFDLVVFVASLIPAVGQLATIARLARVLRVARIVSVSPKLRLIIATMAKSIPSLGHVGLLLGLLLFIYGVLGVHLFRDADPGHWGDLGTALLTLFQMLTLEGWVELQSASMTAGWWAWLYYATFVVIAVFVVVNLFVAVVLSNLDQASRELRAESSDPTIADVLAELRALHARLDERDHSASSRGRPSGPISDRSPRQA